MKISEIFPRKALSVDDLEDGKAYRSAIDRVEVRDGPRGPRAVLILGTPVRGFREVYLNRSSAHALARVMGDETDDWRGQILIFRKLFPNGRLGIQVVPANQNQKGEK